MKTLRGLVRDLLVQVNKFCYPINFVVLIGEPVQRGVTSVLIILGKPFLATTNALINCGNSVMQLTFCKMALEINIFNLTKQPTTPEEEDHEEVCLIDAGI